MQINWGEILEAAIVGKVVSTLIDEGFRVQLSDQDGGGLFVYAMPDGEEFPSEPGSVNHWVRLVPGNGPDVISDYTVNLQDTLKEVNEFAAQFAS